jgi:hypothetical protein
MVDNIVAIEVFKEWDQQDEMDEIMAMTTG